MILKANVRWVQPEKMSHTGGSSCRCDVYIQTTNSNYDTVLYIQETCMTDQWACNDDVDFDNGDNSSVLEVDMVAGETAVIVIDGYDEFAKVTTY